MADLLLIPVCIIAGALLIRIKAFPKDSFKAINSLIIYVCLPALTLYYIPQIEISYQLIFPAAAIWIMFLLAVIFFISAGKIFKWDKRTTGALILTGGLANTSFVGFPVLIALFGEEGLKIGVVIDQAGSFLVLSTLGIIVASIYSTGTFSLKKLIYNTLTYPSFIAFIISIVMLAFGIKHNEISSSILSKVGMPTIILALISVGMQLNIKLDKLLWKELVSGLAFKLLLAPLIIFALYLYVFKLNGLIFKVTIIETAMAPMVMGSVLASQFELNPKLANLMVGIGIPLSAATLALWWAVVR
jgi:predicted permease